jgi:RHS repeat-associated protein
MPIKRLHLKLLRSSDGVIFLQLIHFIRKTMIRIHKIISIILAAAGFAIPAFSQEPQPHFELSSPETGTKTYIARDYIQMNTNFSYISTPGQSFKALIDNCLLFPPAANTYALPDGTITTDPAQGGIVGAIPGQFNVSPTGGATYSIPMDVPSGINGMQPGISLVYNSQAGKGIAGWGWNISGLSSITRTKTVGYYDGVDAGITWDKTSPLALDGQRLIKTFESIDSVEYRTENESFARIVGYDIQTWGPSYFKVYTKAGLTMVYGNPLSLATYSPVYTNAYTDGVAGTNYTRTGWCLVEVADNHGNYMTYEYERVIDNHVGNVVKKISYGGNKKKGTSHSLEVVFNYQQRTDDIQMYISEKEALMQLRLSEIRTTVSSTVQRVYTLNYATGYTSRLSSFEVAHNGTRVLHPVTFTYGGTDQPESDTDISFITKDGDGNEKDKIALAAIDLDGDGFNELGDMYLEEASGLPGLSYVYFDVHKKEDSWVTNRRFAVSVAYMDVIKSIKSLHGDFNGNGSAESVFAYFENSNLYMRIRDRKTDEVLYEQELEDSGGKTPFMVVGNFYGHSLSALLVIYDTPVMENSQYKYRYDIFCGVNDGTILKLPSEKYLKVPYKIKSIDKGNFGSITLRDDLWLNLDNGSNFIVKNDKSYDACFSGTTGYQIPLSLNIGEKDICEFTDMNQDGLLDVVYRKNTNDWTTAYNEGNYNFSTRSLSIQCEKYKKGPYDIGADNYDDKDIINFTDINNDGLIDIATGDEMLRVTYTRPRGSGDTIAQYYFLNTIWRFYLNTGNGYTLSQTYTSSQKSAYACFADLFGKGTVNWVHSGTDGKVYITDFGYGLNKNYLSKISDPLQGDRNIEYKTLADFTEYDGIVDTEDNINTTAEYLGKGFQPFRTSSILLASKYTDALTTLSYHYGKALYNARVRGFAGFRYMGVHNETTGIAQFTRNRLYVTSNSYYLLLPRKTESKELTGQTLINSTEQDYFIKSLGSRRFTVQLQTITKTDQLTGIESTENYNSYDNFGNVLEKETIIGDFSELEQYTYKRRGAWCDNKPGTITNTRTNFDLGPGGESENLEIIRQSTFEYDAKGNLTQEIKDPGDKNSVTTVYSDFDDFGHPCTVTVTANGRSHASGVTYTTSGRFVQSKTDALGKTTSYIWDETKGLMNTQTDETGTTTFQYDKADRLSLTILPDKVRTAAALQWAGGTGPSGAAYYSYGETSGSSPVITWFDRMGREIQSDATGLKGGKVIVTTEYNAKGQVWRVSEPYFDGGTKTYASVTTYDNYGRVKTITTPAGTTTYTYNGIKTTVTSPDGVQETELNPQGQVAGSNTNGKWVFYSYYPSGLPKLYLTEDELQVVMEYDLQGNRTKLTDPDAGVVTSEYNGFGQLLWSEQQVSSSGSPVRTTYNYLTNGLTNNIVINTEVTQYGYDDRKRVSTIEIAGKHKQTFTYDGFNRLTKTTEIVNNTKTFATETVYDVFGRVAKEIYPSGYYTVNGYNQYGYLSKVTDNYGKLVWEAKEANARGQITLGAKGSKETTYGYDSRGLPASITCPGVLDMGYTFNAKGNLGQRIDNILDQKEKFNHDGMNRLTNWDIYSSGTLVKQNSITYDATYGNVTGKTDVGYTMNYGEDSKPPHAISSISGNPALIPDATQTVTYTAFQKVSTVSEGTKSLSITYGTDQQRRKCIFNNNGTTFTRYYMGDYEEEVNAAGSIRKLHYVAGGDGLAAIFVQNGGKDTLYYCYTDYQGNLLAVTNESGTVLQRLAYDPWGARRNPTNWAENDARTSFLFARGYTLHEHLDAFNLINMNGRMYDPQVARFLSPDPYIQNDGNWLNYNRYAYCLNSPLSYTDPSGNEITFMAAMLIYSGASALFNGLYSANASGNFDWSGFWQGAGTSLAFSAMGMGFGQLGGAVSSALGINGAIGQGIFNGVWSFAGAGLTSYAVSGSWDWQASLISGAQGFLMGLARGNPNSNHTQFFGDYGEGGDGYYNGGDPSKRTRYHYDANRNIYANLDAVDVVAPKNWNNWNALHGWDRFWAIYHIFMHGTPDGKGTPNIEKVTILNNPVSLLVGGGAASGVTRVTENVASIAPRTIESISPHAVNQAITRGYKTTDILQIVREGTPQLANGRFGPQWRYMYKGNTVIINATKNRVITVFSTNPGTKNGLGAGYIKLF